MATSEEGIGRKITAQVCDVSRGLMSVSKIAKSGSRVVFDKEEAYIEDKRSGERMYLQEKNGMYMLSMWTRKGF